MVVYSLKVVLHNSPTWLDDFCDVMSQVARTSRVSWINFFFYADDATTFELSGDAEIAEAGINTLDNHFLPKNNFLTKNGTWRQVAVPHHTE